MTEHPVEQLRYVADDELGIYCEALLIRCGKKVYYVMHRGRGNYNGERPVFVHEKIVFSEKESLLNDFPGLYTSGWKETNARCDYDVPLAEFQAARKRGLQGRLERML
ncbi:hypothetical protein J4230_00930 [Candidatus Woesearchaeota archaeon]|nr:hypothetical protein [Candidatus Woesearchaeota archaeon]